jgi:hypothetical protein
MSRKIFNSSGICLVRRGIGSPRPFREMERLARNHGISGHNRPGKGNVTIAICGNHGYNPDTGNGSWSNVGWYKPAAASF